LLFGEGPGINHLHHQGLQDVDESVGVCFDQIVDNLLDLLEQFDQGMNNHLLYEIHLFSFVTSDI
jgi:hypothetical protein